MKQSRLHLLAGWWRRSPMLGLAVAASFSVLALLANAHIAKNPLRADEVDYYRSMENVFKLGLPLYYAGEVTLNPNSLIHLASRRFGEQQFEFYRYKPETGILKETFFALADGTSRYTYGMWHPPLYIYVGAIFLRLAPVTVDTSFLLRYLNLAFSIGILIGMTALSRTLYPNRHRLTAMVAMLCYIFNSLVVRGTILIDYNATMAPCIATWLAIACLRSARRRDLDPGLCALTVVAFLTGLGVGAALWGGVVLYVLVTLPIKRSWHAIVSVTAGAVAFLPIFFALSRLLSLPFSQPFLHNVQRSGAYTDPNWIATFSKSVMQFGLYYSREIGYPLMLVALLLLVRVVAIKHVLREPERLLLPCFIIAGFVLQGGLRAEAYGFPKYILYLLPLLFVFLAGETLNWYHSLRITRPVIVLALTALLLTEGLMMVNDLRQPGSTLYFKNQTGVETISRLVASSTSPDETILSPKDVAFFARRRFVQWYGAPLTNVNLLQRRITGDRITTLVSDTASLNTTSPAVAEYLHNSFALEWQTGDFRILRLITAR